MKTAVIYARVSSTTDRQNTERQVVDLRMYAEFAQYDVVNTFEEKISGAKKNEERKTLQEALSYCIDNDIDILLVSELSRIGRSSFEVLETIKLLVDHQINLYLQKEQFTLLNEDGKPSTFAPIMLATLSTCAELERENIKFRLNSGRAKYIADGGYVGRPKGTKKTAEQLEKEYPKVVKELKNGTSLRRTAKLCDVSLPTVQKVKKVLGIVPPAKTDRA